MRVIWEIDVDEEEDPRKAALEALEIMRDPDSTALVFTVGDHPFERVTVDLLEKTS